MSTRYDPNLEITKRVQNLDELLGKASRPGRWNEQDLIKALAEIDNIATILLDSFGDPAAVDFQLKPMETTADTAAFQNLVAEYKNYVANLNNSDFFERLRTEFRDLNIDLIAEQKRKSAMPGPIFAGGLFSAVYTSTAAITQLAIMAANSVSYAQIAASSMFGLGFFPGVGTIIGLLTAGGMLMKELNGEVPHDKMTNTEQIVYRLGFALAIMGTLTAVSTIVAGLVVGFPYVAIPLTVAGALIGLGTILYSGSLYKYSNNTEASSKVIRDIKDDLKQLRAGPSKIVHIFSKPKEERVPELTMQLAKFKTVSKWVI